MDWSGTAVHRDRGGIGGQEEGAQSFSVADAAYAVTAAHVRDMARTLLGYYNGTVDSITPTTMDGYPAADFVMTPRNTPEPRKMLGRLVFTPRYMVQIITGIKASEKPTGEQLHQHAVASLVLPGTGA